MLRNIILLSIALVYTLNINAQNPKKIIQSVNARFSKVQSYSSKGLLKFNIPSVKISSLPVKIYYKKPDKFRMVSTGLFFMPKQNPTQNMMKVLADTNAYTAVYMGKEIVAGKPCHIINILPVKDMGEFIVGKFWINDAEGLVYKSEITSKNAGTIITQSKFGAMATYALPDEIELTMDVNKFKIPKMLALDINKKKVSEPVDPNKKVASKITIVFSDYKVNTTVDDAVFGQ
jgi:hypothetical protein